MDTADELSLSSHFRQVHKNSPDAKTLAELMAFEFTEAYADSKTGWGTYYGPAMVNSNGKENVYEFPSIRHIDHNMLEYWSARSNQTTNPVMKARYLDLVIDFNKKVTGKASDVGLIKSLVSVVVEISRIAKLEFYLIKRKLKRALHLALKYSLTDEVETLRDAIINFEKRFAGSKNFPIGLSYDTLILENTIVLPDGVESQIIQDLEETLKSKVSTDQYRAELVAEKLASYYRRKKLPHEVRRILTFLEEFITPGLEGAAAMQKVAAYKKLHSLYVNFEMKDAAQRLSVLIRKLAPDVNSEMQTISIKKEINRDTIESIVAKFFKGSTKEVLSKIAIGFVPTRQGSKDRLEARSKKNPILYLTSVDLMDKHGRIIAVLGPLEQDPEGWVVHEISDTISMDLFLPICIDRLIREIKLEAILSLVKESQVFEAARVPIIEAGLQAFERKDFMMCMHLLIPQIEQCIRYLAECCDVPVYKISRNGSQQFRTLDDLLRDEQMVSILGDDLALYFQTLLTDQRGLNLRNKVCHGLIDAEDFTHLHASAIIHALLCLAHFRLRPL